MFKQILKLPFFLLTLGEIAAQAATYLPLAEFVSWCMQAPCSRMKDFNPQPKLVLIYQYRKDERLSRPD